jgi:hypothetical protein
MERIRKYPRTPHLESSCPQPGAEDLDVVAFPPLVGRQLVVDGANAGISFGPGGELRLQSLSVDEACDRLVLSVRGPVGPPNWWRRSGACLSSIRPGADGVRTDGPTVLVRYVPTGS